MKFFLTNSYDNVSKYMPNIESEFYYEVLTNDDDELCVFIEINNLSDVLTLKNIVNSRLIIGDYDNYCKSKLEKLYPDYDYPKLQIMIYDGWIE